MRAVVIGAGYAGEGHTLALRYAGVEVAAICARDQDVVGRVAERLGVPAGSTDWRATLEDLRPDIVSLATPAVLRREVIEVAAERGIHVFCDKPLATTAAEAEANYAVAHAAGIKHAFASTRWYEPSVAWAAEVVREGIISQVQEGLMTLTACLASPVPWSWVMRLDLGGGLLNNNFMHQIAILERIVGGELCFATGHANFAIESAPYVGAIHDYRELLDRVGRETPEDYEGSDWRPCDVDTSYSACLRFRTITGEPSIALTSGPAALPRDESGIRLTGSKGCLRARGEGAFALAKLNRDGAWERDLPIPAIFSDDLPDVGNPIGNRYAALASAFVADIRGEAHDRYLTFRDGARYQHAAEAIRGGSTWRAPDARQ